MQFLDDSAASEIRLDDGTVLTRCDQCRTAWRERNERGITGNPPCDSCRVDPMEENEEAFGIFFTVRNQLIVSMGGVVDVSHDAIHRAMELYGIRRRRECFEKVLRLSRWWVAKLNKEGAHES